MVLVPKFELSQNDREVVVLVYVSTIRIDSIEVLLDEESVLHFYAHPYSLTLNFAPQEFDNDAQGIVSAQYDPSKNTIRIPLIKANPGVTWSNLEFTARLLQPKEIPKQWLHEVSSSTTTTTTTTTTNINESSEDTDNIIQQQENNLEKELKSNFGYGFGNLFQNVFTDYFKSGLSQEMLSLSEPESTKPSERQSLRRDKELEDFDPDRYDYELEQDYMYPMVMHFIPFWNKKDTTTEQQLADVLQERLKISPTTSSTAVKPTSSFNDNEKLTLSTIPYPLIPKSLMMIDSDWLWCGLLDLLVPYVYDHLMTMGDPTVESAWTISKLSSSLSWLDPPKSIQEAIITLTRRMLIYPYWRNFEFSINVVWNHVISILEKGELHVIIKCLLQVRKILEKSEFYYAGNKLFVDPYLYWIQHQDVKGVRKFALSLRQVLNKKAVTLKDDLELDLAIYERLVMGEEESDDSDCSYTDDDESDSSSDSDSDREEEEEQEDNENSNVIEPEEDTTNRQVSSALLDSEMNENDNHNVFGMLVTEVEESKESREKSNPLIQEIDDDR